MLRDESLLVISSYRFHNQRTAFDVDIDTLPEQPWRKPHTDYSDYFNFGFTGRYASTIHTSAAVDSPAL